MFERYEPQKLEKRILKFWSDKGIHKNVKKVTSGRKPFFFADGPPYATGNIHMGTGWNKIIKDTYIRFWRMQGFDVWDQPGYDTHGTPIEHQVEKRLGFSSKKDIEAYGADKFIKKCREFATKFIGVMSKEFMNLGVWMDWDKPYITLHNSYIEGAWFTFKRAHDKGLLYKGLYPVHVCSSCGTAVSYNEIEHERVTDDSIYVKFPIKGRDREFFIVWTTTPWTLPANTGVMVHPTFSYSMVEVPNGEKYVIATDLVDTVMEKAEIESYTTVDKFSGDNLSGMLYEHPLKDIVPAIHGLEGAHRIVTSARYVNLESGTGLVHTAPGHGSEDYQVGVQEGLPVVSPVDLNGCFTKGAGTWLDGRYVKDADKMIISKLNERHVLLKKESISHEYPMCWRCGTPLLQMSVPQWFFKITSIRSKLLEENKKINWVPSWAGNRFRDWLQNLGDWPISRQRYWGIPLPIWECECGEIDVIGSFSDLKKKANLDKEIDFHRPDIDMVMVPCPKCKAMMKRTPDVLDVWFDSGVSTWAALEYPRKKALYEKLWPSSFQTEGPDQIRGWWNSQMITSVLTFDKSPFGTIMLHGFVLDAHGAKMSKSKGNTVTPAEVIEMYGRDVLRFYLMSSAPWDDFYFNWDSAKETARLFNVFWNVYQFTKAYAPKMPASRPSSMMPEDRWIVSRVENLITQTEHAKSYNIHKLVAGTGALMLNDLSRWYLTLVRHRLSPRHKGKDKKAAEWTLHYCLEKLVKLLAPVSPFISEHIYQDMFRKGFSVHVEDWPTSNNKLTDERLEKSMETVRDLIEAMNSAREEKKIKLKWPLDAVHIYPKDNDAASAVKKMEDIISLMGNVREVIIIPKASRGMKEFSGGRLGLGDVLEDEAMVRELVRAVQVLRKKEGLKVTEKIRLSLKTDKDTEDTLRERKKEIMSGVGASEISWKHSSKKGSCSFRDKTINIWFRKA